MADDSELLFFDTFSHDTCEELNLDLVQFPRPVYIFEIRIIPLGARVQADFPGGHRLGATNPSSFQLEFFVNDLSRRSACTFERLGSLDYKQNVDIQFPVANKIPTDGLVLRGWYSAVTLAVYGVLTKSSTKERTSPPPPPPPQSVSRSQSQDHHSAVEASVKTEWDRTPRLIDTVTSATAEPPLPPVRPHPPPVAEPQRFADMSPIIHQPPPEQHLQYSTELPQPVYPEPPPPVVYAECVPTSVPPGPPPSYPPYDARYTKPWPQHEKSFPPQSEGYDHSVYNQPHETGLFPPTSGPPPPPTHPLWDSKECHAPREIPRQEHDLYEQSSHHELKFNPRDKDSGPRDRDRSRDRPWERDRHSAEYSDDGSRDRDYKRKDREHRSWEREGVTENDKYRERERDRGKDSSNRDRNRDRERSRDGGRERPRSHERYNDRCPRPMANKDSRESSFTKRPMTPPTPPPTTHTRMPQTPPDIEKSATGPRTPKEEEPSDSYDERIHSSSGQHMDDFYDMGPSEHAPGEPGYNLSEGEIQEGENTDDDGYEEIVSEEEIMSDGDERIIDLVDIEYDLGDDTWNYMANFSPFQCEFSTLQYFSDPTLTTFEVMEEKKNKASKTENSEENKLLEILKSFEKAEHNEKWVEAIESLSVASMAEGLLNINSKEVFQSTVETLVNWVVEGLNFDLALQQPQTAYKVRHLKAGIRLATLLFQTNVEIIEKLLNVEAPRLLLQLFEQPHMVLPVKMLILRALDSVTYTTAGLEYLLKKTLKFQPPTKFDFSNKTEEEESIIEDKCEYVSMTGYQKLLQLLMSKQLTRVVVSVSALLQKIHLYEVLVELQEMVDNLIQNTSVAEEKDDKMSEEAVSTPERVTSETEADFPAESQVEIIVTCLNEITLAYRTAWKNIAQQKRYLPAEIQFEFPKSPFDPFSGLLRMFKERQLLESLFVLLVSPAVSGHTALLRAIRDLFTELLQFQNGILYMLSLPEAINGIQRSLLQNVDDSRDENNEESVTQSLGMHIVYHLQALTYVDSLMAYHTKSSNSKKEIDDPEAVSVLHLMYTMIFSPVGRLAVINVLSTDHNLNSLIPFVQITGEEELDMKIAKSVSAGYSTELLMLVVSYCENVQMLENFSEILFSLSQQEVTPKLQDLSQWMSPAQKIPNFSHEAVGILTGILKSHLEDATTLPPELITAVRILQHITLSPENQNTELKYMYSLIQVFRNDGFSYFLTILQSVCDTFLKLSHQSVALVGLQGVMVVSLVKPIIFMMKKILAYLISCRGTEFKDLTAVPVLLQVYSLMLTIPTSSFSFHLAQEVQREIVEALLCYTQPCLGSTESEEALSKSLWTQMVHGILKYAQQSPGTFVAGLTIFSELLPLPLPLQTREALSEEEVSRTINHRKLWSAHLHSLSETIQEIIISLAGSSCQPLQQLLRRVCVQLADLSAPTALVVVRAVLDGLLETLLPSPAAEIKEISENSARPHTPPPPPLVPSSIPLKPCSSSAARMLNLLTYLMSNAAFKIPLMQVIRGSAKVDEKYMDVLNLLLNLLNLPSDKTSHIQSQECIVSIIQSLCDLDIGFITLESGASVTEVLANCLPVKEHISLICNALVQHIGSQQHNYASILPSLRSLVMLTEHDYGFYHVKLSLEQNPNVLFSLFTRLNTFFSKDSSDCLSTVISTLSTGIEFLRILLHGYEGGAEMGRTMVLTSAELAVLLAGKPKNSGEKANKDFDSKTAFKPLLDLEKTLAECSHDEAGESLLESISGLIQLLSDGLKKDVKIDHKENVELILPASESQSSQFASRPVFLIGEVEEDRLSPSYWLSVACAEDADQEQEQVMMDFIGLAEKCISGEFDLKSSLESLCLSAEPNSEVKTKKKVLSTFSGKRKYQPLINPGIPDINNKRPFIAPMRGRGLFSRGNSTRANDPFRSRPPNTSRPPSMHVDDFVAFESHHTGPSSQAPPKRQDGPRGRGRGFERGPSFTSQRGGGGGRFFSPPGPYGRRDVGGRGGNRGVSRISNSNWGNRSGSGSTQKSPTGSNIRTNFNSRQRCGYNVPFPQSESRSLVQRNRDPYSDVGLSPGSASAGRFRGGRAGGVGSSAQGHWQDNRNKSQNQRFITSGARGSGRRDMNSRHLRNFTR